MKENNKKPGKQEDRGKEKHDRKKETKKGTHYIIYRKGERERYGRRVMRVQSLSRKDTTSLRKEAENGDVPRPYGYTNHARAVRAAHGCGTRTAPVAFLRYTTGGCRGYKKGREAG